MTDITIRALLEQALEALDNIPHPPWRDKELADAIRAELAKPSAPAWHDAPTGAGHMVLRRRPSRLLHQILGDRHNIVFIDSLNDPALKDDECRWWPAAHGTMSDR